MTPRSRRTLTERGGRGDAPPRALTADAWYTVIYLSPSDRRDLERRRTAIWSRPLAGAGLSRAEILRLLERRQRWVRDLEVAGRTPPVDEQVAQLGSWSARTLDPEEFLPALDRALLQTRVKVAPGAGEALRALADRGVPMGLVSNILNETGEAARKLLEGVNLARWFRVLYLSGEHRWAKPSPAPFRAVARFLEVDPRAIAHVGDLSYDLVGARAAGFAAWWYVGLRRLNGYLPGQVGPRLGRSARSIHHWRDIPRLVGTR